MGQQPERDATGADMYAELGVIVSNEQREAARDWARTTLAAKDAGQVPGLRDELRRRYRAA